MDSNLPDDSYKWWVGRRVDVLDADRRWLHAEVIEAARSVLFDLDARRSYYEAQPGEPDGDMRLIVMLGKRQSEILSAEIFPGGPFGIVPSVVPHFEPDAQVATWWRALTPAAKASLSADPDGYVNPAVLREVVEKGATLTGAYWPDSQSEPGGFMLPARHQRVVAAVALKQSYVRAEERLTKAVARHGDQSSLADAYYFAGIRELEESRDRAKLSLDLHCVGHSS